MNSYTELHSFLYWFMSLYSSRFFTNLPKIHTIMKQCINHSINVSFSTTDQLASATHTLNIIFSTSTLEVDYNVKHKYVISPSAM
jgi:hypothetical protein